MKNVAMEAGIERLQSKLDATNQITPCLSNAVHVPVTRINDGDAQHGEEGTPLRAIFIPEHNIKAHAYRLGRE